MSSGGPYSFPSGLSSPVSIMSGPSVLRTGSSPSMALCHSPPIMLSPSASSVRKFPSGPQSQAKAHGRQSIEASELRQLVAPMGNRDAQQPKTTVAFPEPFDPRLAQGRTDSLEFPRRAVRVPASFQRIASDSSSKSSVASTWSSIITANSSMLPPSKRDEPKETGRSLPPLAGPKGPGGSPQTIEKVAGQTTPSSIRAQQSPHSPLASSSAGMRFESLQLPLPHSISFGQHPLPWPKHEAKLANVFDLQDIPGYRSSLQDKLSQVEHAAPPGPIAQQGFLKPRHPLHVPQLPSLDPQPRNITRDRPDSGADLLSILASAGSLVGRASRPPS